MSLDHKRRVREELIKAGVTPYGLTKYEARHLHNVIEQDESIGGVVYGQVEGLESAFLVATNKRVIFLDRKPLYSNMDELTYDVVSGVNLSVAANRASVVLHTRVRDYSMRFVKISCAEKFAKYIEKKKQEFLSKTNSSLYKNNSFGFQQPTRKAVIDKDALAFLQNNEIAVLSTIDRGGNVSGSVVYYLLNKQNDIFILTQSQSHKTQNLLANPKVALTIYQYNSQKTAQIQGVASLINDPKLINDLYINAMRLRSYGENKYVSPVTRLTKGNFVAIMITPTHCLFHDYSSE